MQASRRLVRGALAALLALGCGCAPHPPASVPDPQTQPPTPDEIQAEYTEAARTTWTRGVYLRERGDAAGALHSFGEAVRLAPRHAEFRLAYAELLVDLGRLREATSFLEGAVQRFGGSASEHLLLARLAVASGEAAVAQARTESALARDATLAPAWVLRGRLLLDADRAGEALRCYQRADSLQSDDIETLEGLADAARAARDTAAAQGALEHILHIDPARKDARRSLAAIYRDTGRADDAKQLVLHGLALDPDDPERVEAAVESLLHAGDIEGAERLLRPYQARGALDPHLAYLYGRLLLQIDHLAAADSVLRPLAGVEGLHGVETLLGDIAARGERSDEAVAHYRKAIAEDPDDCVPRASLALLRVRGTAEPGAAADAVTAADSDLAEAMRRAHDDDYRCNLLVGLACMSRKRYTDAARYFEVARRLDPENRDVLFNLAIASAEGGESEVALQHARTLLRLEPDAAAVLNLVGYVLAERGEDLAESESLIRKALRQEPDNGYYVDSLGWVLYQKGDYAGAANALERAVRLTGEKDALILEHLGDAYVKTGKLAEARRVYASSRKLDPERASLTAKIAAVESKLAKP